MSEPYKTEAQNMMQRYGAIAMVGMGLCYLALFVIYGAYLSFPATDAVIDKMDYLVAERTLINTSYFVGYLLFGCLLLVSVQATYDRFKTAAGSLLATASLFGLIWVAMVLSAGMIALIGFSQVAELHSAGSTQAAALYYTTTTIANALGGGIELVGGLWVLLLTISGRRAGMLSMPLAIFGGIVGLLGIATLEFEITEIKDAFGLTQIIWFFWFGGMMWRSQKVSH